MDNYIKRIICFLFGHKKRITKHDRIVCDRCNKILHDWNYEGERNGF